MSHDPSDLYYKVIHVTLLPFKLQLTMEAKMIESFLPDLVTAISDCVQPVSDQCLAKELTKEYWSQEGPVKTKPGL